MHAGFSGDLLRPHVFPLDAGDDDRLLHGVAAERFAEFLVEHDLDEGGDALFLILAGLPQRIGQFSLGPHGDALEAAAFGDLGVAQVGIEFGADEVVGVPEDRIALLGAPLVIAEHNHGDSRPVIAADRAHFAHRDSERAVAGEAYAWGVGVADLGADDRGKSVAAWSEQSGRKIFAALFNREIAVTDRTIIADVAGDDGVTGQARLDRTPGLARRHQILIALAGVRVPGGARLGIRGVHAGRGLEP